MSLARSNENIAYRHIKFFRLNFQSLVSNLINKKLTQNKNIVKILNDKARKKSMLNYKKTAYCVVSMRSYPGPGLSYCT